MNEDQARRVSYVTGCLMAAQSELEEQGYTQAAEFVEAAVMALTLEARAKDGNHAGLA